MTDKINDQLDDAIKAIKADTLSAMEIADAADRARAALAAQRGPQGVIGEETESHERWNSIDDYIAAIPAYLAKQLSPEQTLLFEEETRQSIPLRRALNEARGRNEKDRKEQQTTGSSESKFSTRWMSLAATVAVMAIGLFILLPQLPSFNQTALAQVDSINGQLYQLVDGRLATLEPGTWVDGRQRIRSANGSKAFLTLDDGSVIEVDERSELSLTRRSSGNRIDVSRGRILVHAAPQASGTLDVFTDEMEVSVVGTIFEVAHGAKGSRVAVVEGSVDVLLQGSKTSLEPGDVMGSRTQYLARNAADEISWSDNADDYIAMLQEVSALQEDLQALIETPPRYSTRLLDLAPEDTAMYIAVPNAPEKIAEVYEVIQLRAQSSEFLADQWSEFEEATEGQYLDEVMAWLREIGYTLGEETVFIITHDGDRNNEDLSVPIVLSEVDAEAFAASFEAMEEQLEEVLLAEGLDADEFEMALIDDPADAQDGELSIMLIDDIMVATIDAASLANMTAIVEAGGSAFVDSELHELLTASYLQGTQILGAVDISLLVNDVDEDEAELQRAGLENLEYLVAQQHIDDGWSTITGDLYFDGSRQGAMSWIAEPAPMGSLEFFSADTTVVGAMLLKEPLAIIEELELEYELDEPGAQEAFELFMQVMAVLGGEFAVGLDGPALPTPAWKGVVEAYDPEIVQAGIEWSIDRINAEAAEEGGESSVEIAAADVGSYTGYQVTLNINEAALQDSEIELDIGSLSFQYAYVDGYLVAAPDAALINRAIDFYQSGSGLQTSSEFRELLARDGYLDFSAVYFSRLGELFSSIMGALPSDITEEQQAAIDSLNTEIGPSMISVLALDDKMHIAHSGSTEFPARLLSQLTLLAPLLEDLEEEVQIID